MTFCKSLNGLIIAKCCLTRNSGYNILELYNILVKIRFTTSKRKLDISYSKLGIRVASRVTKRLKTQDPRKLGNITKISNLGGHIAQCLVSFQEPKLCKQQLKNMQKQIPNFCFPVQLYRITAFCSKYFFLDCLGKQISHPYSAQSPSNSNFLSFFITPKRPYKLQ